jgi:hypothetical protein
MIVLSALADPYHRVSFFGIPLMNLQALVATTAYGTGGLSGHGAHLSGAVFGVMYYHVGPRLWAWPRGLETRDYLLGKRTG